MGTRCQRCQKREVTLETFGVYVCPDCGRVDADGKLLDPVAPPQAVEGEAPRPSFAAPPPKEWVPPGAPPPAPIAASGSGPPTFFLTMVAIDALVTLGSALSARSACAAVLGISFLIPLASGKPWARNLALLGSSLEILLVLVVLVVARAQLPAVVRGALAGDLIVQMLWVYALMRAETVRYFSRR